MIDAVEEAFDVDIDDPVISPASLTSCPDRVNRGTPGSIPIRIRMEHRLQQRFQVSANNLLSDTIGNRRNTQRPRPARRLRYVHPPNRRRHVAARRQSVPELIEVIAEALLEVLDRLPIHASRSLVGLHTLEGLPDFPLRDVERLCPNHAAPPVTGWPPARTEHHNPFGPPPLQRLQPYYGLFCPCAPHWYSRPHGDRPLDPLPWHRSDKFPRSVREPDPGSRRLRAGCRMSRASGLRSGLSRDDHHSRFRHHPYYFDLSSTVRFRSSPWTSPDGIRSRLFRDAHHHRSFRQQLAVVWNPLLIADSEGPALISHTVPHLHRCWCVRGTR